jgi:molybdopterin synthase sulfur carrier subunit
MARVRFFAALRDLTGTGTDEIEASTVGEVITAAVERYGEKFEKSLGFSKVAVNGRLISELQGEATTVVSDDEVAFLPPVSGGGSADRIRR